MKTKNISRRSFLTTITAGMAVAATANVIQPMESISQRIGTKSEKSSGELKIGVFDVDATPPVGSQLTYDRMINSSDLGLRAKGIVLTGAGAPIILCAIDWIGISNESQDIFKQSLAVAAGTTPERVAVHTVHQHDAPICDFTAERLLKENNLPVGCFDGSFARILIKNIQEAIINAGKVLQPVTDIGLGKAPVYEVASNRRVDMVDGKIKTMRGSACNDSLLRDKPEGLIDPDVSLISFWNKDKPLAVLSFYATHPQSYYRTGIANPDFPGIARFLRQLAVPDALHVHFNGAGGNIAAGKYNDGSHENRFLLAEKMADGMERAWHNIRKYPVSAKNVRWTTEPILLPANPSTAEIEKNMATGNGPYLANNMGRLGWYKRVLEGKTIDIGCLTVNEAQIFFMPGELFVEYQLAAKAMAPDKFVTMAAYGDYGPFYIGTKEAYGEGGYEILSSPVTEDAEIIILNAIQSLNDKLQKP
ncbi:twin-arginine translocation signal domain-containing protein [uncultured Proteiniphilum sp.]|uniref:twin-arginine translocation signal domain-containing protein n=1 Tax=uncultured Proteiniphilum sp. TaxID=497637 RepID=UPI00260540B4|nr:twin-arginine translocation signal domain-containing protein [uncultured Proteiniphilum sp.]